MTEPTTDDRPTDTIRDAFEAMLWFLACVIGPLRPRKITPAEEIGALAACEVETDFEPDEPPAPLLALRDLIQRAAEEHNRRATTGDDWTPERIREARERCERATPRMVYERTPDDGYQIIAGTADDNATAEDEERIGFFEKEDDARFCVHAREDLPAALAWGEQQSRIAAGNAALEASQRTEIERLTAELATADGATTVAAKALCEWQDRAIAAEAELAARAPADASRPGLTLEQSRTWVERRFPSLVGHAKQCCIEIAVRASRGETGPAHPLEWTCPKCGQRAVGLGARQSPELGCERCGHVERPAADLGPGVGGAPIRVRPPAGRRATLHAGDPASVPPPFMPAPSDPRPCRLCSPELGPCRAHAGRES